MAFVHTTVPSAEPAASGYNSLTTPRQAAANERQRGGGGKWWPPSRAGIATAIVVANVVAFVIAASVIGTAHRRAGRGEGGSGGDNTATAGSIVDDLAWARIKYAGSGESLVMADEFDAADWSFWRHELTMGGGGNGEFQAYVNSRNNSFVRGGALHIKVRGGALPGSSVSRTSFLQPAATACHALLPTRLARFRASLAGHTDIRRPRRGGDRQRRAAGSSGHRPRIAVYRATMEWLLSHFLWRAGGAAADHVGEASHRRELPIPVRQGGGAAPAASRPLAVAGAVAAPRLLGVRRVASIR